MRYIKHFDKSSFKPIPINKHDVIIYYKLNIDKSVIKFNVALDKLGVKDFFYSNWINIDQQYEQTFFDEEMSKFDVIYLSVDYGNDTIDYFKNKPYNDTLLSLRDEDDRDVNIIYGGEISIPDFYVDKEVYNL
jgi:hypothetical protein